MATSKKKKEYRIKRTKKDALTEEIVGRNQLISALISPYQPHRIW
jgi:hypothetical protein